MSVKSDKELAKNGLFPLLGQSFTTLPLEFFMNSLRAFKNIKIHNITRDFIIRRAIMIKRIIGHPRANKSDYGPRRRELGVLPICFGYLPYRPHHRRGRGRYYITIVIIFRHAGVGVGGGGRNYSVSFFR